LTGRLARAVSGGLSEAARPSIIHAPKPTREAPMITEIITFKLRPGMTREDVVAA